MNIRDAQIAVLAENLYQELEPCYPMVPPREAGANVLVVCPTDNQAYASKLGYPVHPDLAVGDLNAENVDAVVIPSGFAPEGMRRHEAMVDLVRNVHDQGGSVEAICHAGWMLASAGIAQGRNVTCVSIIKDDVINAGGSHADAEVVRDGNIITSRLPSDPQVFCREIIAYLEIAPRRRNNGRVLTPVGGGRPAVLAEFANPVHVVTGPRGKASANYTTMAISGDAGRAH